MSRIHGMSIAFAAWACWIAPVAAAPPARSAAEVVIPSVANAPRTSPAATVVTPGVAAVPPASPAAEVVAPGDVLHIEVHAGGQKHADLAVTISPEGTIVLPLLGELRVAGMGAREITGNLRQALDRDYYVNPQVLVAIRERAGKVFVAGEIRRPGAYPLQPGLTLLQACDLAGGFTDYSAGSRVILTRLRGGGTERLRVDLSSIRRGRQPDVVLRDGDRIEVPQRWF